MHRGIKHAMDTAPIKEWSQRQDSRFAEAVEAIKEDMENNDVEFEGSLSHYADLFNIEESALRHEWNLRNEDTR